MKEMRKQLCGQHIYIASNYCSLPWDINHQPGPWDNYRKPISFTIDETGHPHSEDSPAVVNYDGTKEWWFHGVRHREDGPAIEYAEGGYLCFLKGEQVLAKDLKVLIAIKTEFKQASIDSGLSLNI